MTTDQIGVAFFDSVERARKRLAQLVDLGVVDRFRPFRATGSAPYHYVLGPLGAALRAAARGDDADAAYRRWRPARATALQHRVTLAHQVGVAGVYATLRGHSRRHPAAGALHRWLNDTQAAALFDRLVHPDAYLVWRGPDGRDVDAFLEFDRATESRPRLLDKLSRYAQLDAERGAATWVLFAFTSRRRELTARHSLAARRPTVPVATTTLAGLDTPPRWQPLDGPDPLDPLDLAALAATPRPPEALDRAAAGGDRAWRFDPQHVDADEEPPLDL